MDVNNPKCVDATQTINSSTRLKNLVDNTSIEFYSPDTTTATFDAMSFALDNGNYVYNQVSTAGGEPGWASTTNVERTADFTFVVWFKWQVGSTFQRADNIYGGGFNGRTSFYLSPGGTSNSHGLLRYSDAGSANSYSVTSSHGLNDGQWHCLVGRDSGPDGNHTSEFWADGELKQIGNSNTAHEVNDGTQQMTWGSWSTTYGNFGGQTNMYMYWDRAISDDEIRQVYNATRGRFGV
jgi:hypothetical protein